MFDVSVSPLFLYLNWSFEIPLVLSVASPCTSHDLRKQNAVKQFVTRGVCSCSHGKRKMTISYPCVMLNVDVFVNNTNNQYQVRRERLLRAP